MVFKHTVSWYYMMVACVLWQISPVKPQSLPKMHLVHGCNNLKNILPLGHLSPVAFILNPFANITAISEQTAGIWGLSMSAPTDSFPRSHITNHLLSTYPVFKAIFSSDGKCVVCIKVKSESHLPVLSANIKVKVSPSSFMSNCMQRRKNVFQNKYIFYFSADVLCCF